MKPNKHHYIIGFLLLLAVVFVVMIPKSGAKEELPEVVQNAVDAIKDNQRFIARYRMIVEQWNNRKDNNQVQFGILLGNGYEYDWETNTAVPVDPSHLNQGEPSRPL